MNNNKHGKFLEPVNDIDMFNLGGTLYYFKYVNSSSRRPTNTTSQQDPCFPEPKVNLLLLPPFPEKMFSRLAGLRKLLATKSQPAGFIVP